MLFVRKRELEVAALTICIATIAENGKKLVAASDKIITYASPPYHLFEHPRPKVDMLNKKVL